MSIQPRKYAVIVCCPSFFHDHFPRVRLGVPAKPALEDFNAVRRIVQCRPRWRFACWAIALREEWGGLPAVIAHRGASAIAPENTMAAFEAALNMNVDGIELDCQLTKDGHLVVIHDPTLDRTTRTSGFVRDHTLAELQRLDAGSWFDQTFRDERIPTLADVLALVRGRCFLNVELKNLPFRYDGIEEALIALVHATGFPWDDLIVSSFDHPLLARLQTLKSSLRIAALFSSYPMSLNSLPGPVLHPHWSVVNADFMAEARAAHRVVNAWTANVPPMWEHLVNHGVDGIVTDHPDKLRAWLNERR